MEGKELQEIVSGYREDLHQIPEVGFTEVKTQNYIVEELKKIGLTPHKIAKTGVYVYIEGKNKDICHGFRGDIDALPVMEETNRELKSTHSGYMHACGHDGHTSTILAFGRYLKGIEKELKESVLLIFQPAEEGPGGAKVILEEGLFKKYNVKDVFALHVMPNLDEGVVATRKGAITSIPTNLDIEIVGKGGHGAMPHQCIDTILIASKLVESYQSIISRNVPALDQGIISIGSISGGKARNVIAESVRMEGTIRTYSEEVLSKVKDRIEAINKGLEYGYGVKIECNFKTLYPATRNNNELVDRLSSIVDITDVDPMMGAEDFSYFTDEVPGVFFMLGTRNEEKGYIYPLHNPKFDFDSKVLERGVTLFIDILKTLGAL